ncbi:MAG: thioredoxin [Clostridia bacterium]|nr:thioredoxin [Clostridia bacterium]
MVKKINAQQFETEAKKSAVAVVDFSATWCGPCRMLAPVLEAVSEKLAGKADFYNVDVDDAPELAGAYRVQSVPCLVMMKNGKFVDQSIGFKPEAMITAWIESNM